MSTKYKCNIRITNSTNLDFTLGNHNNKHGCYASEPEKIISGKSTIKFTVEQEYAITDGPEGFCEYSNGEHLLHFSYQCPYHTSFYNSKADAIIKSGSGLILQMIPNPIPEESEPLDIQFTILFDSKNK